MISHAKTLNNTPLKEYLDDNLSSLVTVASKYVSQIAAELVPSISAKVNRPFGTSFTTFPFPKVNFALRFPEGILCCTIRGGFTGTAVFI